MLNYPLTEFSLKELKILSGLLYDKIQHKQIDIQRASMVIEGPLREALLKKYNDGFPEIREMHVRVLTAIDIVKQKEITNAN